MPFLLIFNGFAPDGIMQKTATGGLSLVGLGYSIDPTAKGIAAAKEADVVYLDGYTSPVASNMKALVEKAVGAKVEISDRKMIEEGAILELAEKKRVCLLVIGDPMFATTHISLINDARKRNIKTTIISNSSIFNAVGKTGLSPYKFGRTVTLSYWREKYRPVSPLEFIIKNKSIGLHTLVLLDVAEDLGPMDAKTGIRQIREMEKALGKKAVDRIFVISRAGFEDERITFGALEKLDKENLGKPLFCFIVPGDMTDVEESFAKSLVNFLG
jgi:diphthine synthase